MGEIYPVPARSTGERDYLRFQVRAGEILSSSIDVRETMDNVCAAAVETVADICYLILKNSADGLDVIGSAVRDSSRPADTALAQRFLHPDSGYPPNVVDEVVRTGHTVFVPEVDDRFIEEHATSRDHAEFMRRMQYASLIVVPIPGRDGTVLGALGLVRTRGSGERFDESSLLFARGLARSCGIAILRSQDYAASQNVAAQFQAAALPRSLPMVPGVAFDAYYEAADASMLVGGDWYDAFVLPTGDIGMTMGDVCGHGVEAAVLMANVRNALRTALCASLSLEAALKLVDFLVRGDLPRGGYATANVATLDPERGVLRLIAAGHPGPLLYTPDGSVSDPFTERGLPLGLRDPAIERQRTSERTLENGSFLAFFTDGVIEWQRDELAGYDQLRAAIADPGVRTARHPARAIREAVVKGRHADDIALMCVRFER